MVEDVLLARDDVLDESAASQRVLVGQEVRFWVGEGRVGLVTSTPAAGAGHRAGAERGVWDY